MLSVKLLSPSHSEEFLKFHFCYQGSIPFKRILQIIQEHGRRENSIISVVVERPFCDSFVEDEIGITQKVLKEQYSWMPEGRVKDPDVIRFHFFKREIQRPKVLPSELEEFKDDYLGCCVLRPLSREGKRTVMYALIKPIRGENENVYIESTKEFSVKIQREGEEVEFKVNGFPFIQQDGIVGCCATAVIQMATWFLSAVPYKLTQMWKVLDKLRNKASFPIRGLKAKEIKKILSKVATVSTCAYPIQSIEEIDLKSIYRSPEKVIYRCIESGFPVIVGFVTPGGAHTVIVIGHTFEPARWWKLAREHYYGAKETFHTSPDWVDNFIIHDDNFGPYLTLPVDYLRGLANLGEEEKCMIVFPIFPQRLKKEELRGEDIESRVFNLLLALITQREKLRNAFVAKVNMFSNKRVKEIFHKFVEHVIKREILLRTYLIDKETYLFSLDKRLGNESQLRNYYFNADLPSLFWVTEISIPEFYCYQNECIGEILTNVKDNSENLIHIPGFILDLREDKLCLYELPGDPPLYPICREKLK
ncbi:hypothetical protein J7K56_00440 [Candidatus Calescamantes bacterium]|nr:hypothetical protein [Candidatus Calescamantes bacterium]